MSMPNCKWWNPLLCHSPNAAHRTRPRLKNPITDVACDLVAGVASRPDFPSPLLGPGEAIPMSLPSDSGDENLVACEFICTLVSSVDSVDWEGPKGLQPWLVFLCELCPSVLSKPRLLGVLCVSVVESQCQSKAAPLPVPRSEPDTAKMKCSPPPPSVHQCLSSTSTVIRIIPCSMGPAISIS
jgi:hypothetical protein